MFGYELTEGTIARMFKWKKNKEKKKRKKNMVEPKWFAYIFPESKIDIGYRVYGVLLLLLLLCYVNAGIKLCAFVYVRTRITFHNFHIIFGFGIGIYVNVNISSIT